jgi:dTDP-4-amino-4,6-dideoxygalactose transaminase
MNNLDTLMKVPFVDLTAQYQNMKAEIDHAIERVITETAFIGGKYVKAFARDFEAFYGVKHVIPCANGTDSLYIIMRMLGIGPGDEVITAANSWISSSETITQTGARVVFVDADPEYYSMDETKLEAAITPRTKAVIPVHLQGQMCDIEAIQAICDKHGLFLIEDCAQAHIAEFKGIRAGLRSIAASFSFYPGKNLGAYGDAGCIITNDSELAEKCQMYAVHGSLVKHQHQMEGINSRLDGLQASILSAKLPHLPEWTEQRIAVAAQYDKLLAGIPQIVTPKVRPNSKHTYHLYMIRAENRDGLKDFLGEHGIETAVHYPTPLPFLPAYAYLGHTREDFPVAARLQGEVLSIPISPEITDEQIKYVVDCITAFYK